MRRAQWISRHVDAAALVAALRGKRNGSQWMARCPAHEDRVASLSIKQSSDGRVLVHCHAGCSQDRVIDSLKRHGLWGTSQQLPTPKLRLVTGSAENDIAMAVAARRIWDDALPAQGSLVEAYLRSRAITMTPPSGLRFDPALKHPTGRLLPAMVACVANAVGVGDRVSAIHRTFLAPGGEAKAKVEPNRMMLGSCRGGIVVLGLPAHKMLIGEGIETCLSAMQATGIPTLAALSATNLMAVNLPDCVKEIVILADGDDTGEAAAVAAGRRWYRMGLVARIARPPRGQDFNDMLIAHTNGRQMSDAS